jgi:hypothetical protein
MVTGERIPPGFLISGIDLLRQTKQATLNAKKETDRYSIRGVFG